MQFKIQNFAAHSSKPYATLQVDRTIRCRTKDRLENFTMGRLCNIDRAFLNCTAARGTAGGVPSPRLSASWPTLGRASRGLGLQGLRGPIRSQGSHSMLPLHRARRVLQRDVVMSAAVMVCIVQRCLHLVKTLITNCRTTLPPL